MTYHFYWSCDGCQKPFSKKSDILPLVLRDNKNPNAPDDGYHFHNYKCLVNWLLQKKARYIEDKKGLCSFPTSFGRVVFKKKVT